MSPGLAALFWMAASALSILFLSDRRSLHPLILMGAGALACGMGSGMGLARTVQEMESGFGAALASLGMPLIAAFCAEAVLGPAHAPVSAGALGGFAAGAFVQRESAFLILRPARADEADKADKAAAAGALALGISAGSTFLLPSALPLAAAMSFGPPLGRFFFLSLIPAAAAMGAAWILLKPAFPGGTSAFSLSRARILVLLPAALISIGALANLPALSLGSGRLGALARALGQPSAAWGVFLALSLGMAARASGTSRIGERVQEGILKAGPQLALVGMAGALARVLHAGPFFFAASTALGGLGLGIFLPFILAACARAATGSPFAAIVLASAAAAPLAGKADPALSALAACAGSLLFLHGNDGFFWIFSSTAGLGARKTAGILSLGTAIQGLAAFGSVLILSLLTG